MEGLGICKSWQDIKGDAQGCSLVGEHLPSVHKALGLIPSVEKQNKTKQVEQCLEERTRKISTSKGEKPKTHST